MERAKRSPQEIAAHINDMVNGRPWIFTHFERIRHLEADGSMIFEHLDVLEAAFDARDTFTFVELGADYGRWTEVANRAALHMKLKPNLVLVEAEPQHAIAARRYLDQKEVSYKIFDGAVAAKPGNDLFIVEAPPRFRSDPNKPSYESWWGQSLARSANMDTDVTPMARSYQRNPLFKVSEEGWYAIDVTSYSLDQIIADFPFVDMIHMDIQGAEGEVIPAAIDVLTEKVRRIYIETHRTDIEEVCRAALTPRGWMCIRDYRIGTSVDTPLGSFSFPDSGMQSWINPRLY